jgi:hypothetical protein
LIGKYVTLSSPPIGKKEDEKVGKRKGRKGRREGGREMRRKEIERKERKSGWGEGAGYTELIGPS